MAYDYVNAFGEKNVSQHQKLSGAGGAITVRTTFLHEMDFMGIGWICSSASFSSHKRRFILPGIKGEAHYSTGKGMK